MSSKGGVGGDDKLSGLPKSIGRYVVESLVGGGGMARVYRARPPEEFVEAIGKKVVAIKTLLPEFASDPQFREMFEEEAEVSGEIHHPNVVELFDFGQTQEGALFIVMEWIDGVDLARVFRSFRERKLRLNPPIACAIVEQALRGLHAAHTRTDRDGTVRAVVHRDVSPANILIANEGVVKLADFGLARPLNRVRRTLPGIVKGKFSYLAPEQTYDKLVDPRTDVFAAGIVLWEALAARFLFRGKNDLKTVLMVRAAKVADIRAFAPGLDERVVAALDKALHPDPDERFATAQEFADVLLAYLESTHPKVTEKTIAAVVRDVREAEEAETPSQRSRFSLPRIPGPARPPPPLPQRAAAQHATNRSRTSRPTMTEPVPLVRVRDSQRERERASAAPSRPSRAGAAKKRTR